MSKSSMKGAAAQKGPGASGKAQVVHPSAFGSKPGKDARASATVSGGHKTPKLGGAYATFKKYDF